MEGSVRRLLICSVLTLNLGAASYAADMTADEIRSTLIGHDLAWKSAKFKASGITHYNADGTATITMTGGKPESGKWRIKGGKLCDKFGKNKESCSTVSRVDEKTFFMPAYESTSVMQ